MDDDVGYPLISATRWTVARLLSSQDSSALNTDSADSALRAFTAITSRTLATVLRAHNMHSRLVSLPPGILGRVSRHLSFASRVCLSHVCHNLRDTMLDMPGIWKDIEYVCKEEPVRPLDTQGFDRLQLMIGRRGLHTLTLSIDLSSEVLSSRWTRLVCLMPRITFLALSFYVDGLIDYTTIGGPAFWNSAVEALSAPAPLLDYLKLTVSEHSRHQNEWDEFPMRIVAYHPLPLGSTVLAGDTSRLRTCSLEGVRLPSTTFRNVSCFHFSSNSALRVEEIARILSFLPALVSLSLSAPYIDGPAHRGAAPYQSPPGTLRPHVKNLSLSADTLEAETICSLIDFGALKYLEICPGFDAGQVLAAAYPEGDFTYISLTRHGIEILLNDLTTIRCYYVFHGFPALVRACSRATRVFVHEFEWPTDFWGAQVPALPCATLLCVRLASCADMVYRFSHQDALGIFRESGRWEFAALKELHITAPFTRTGTCGHADCSGKCSSHVSVSLRDIADFVRDRIRFDAPKLSAIRLCGLRIVDLDYIAAREELSVLTQNLLLDEDAQHLPCMDLAHVESLPTFCDRFQDYE